MINLPNTLTLSDCAVTRCTNAKRGRRKGPQPPWDRAVFQPQVFLEQKASTGASRLETPVLETETAWDDQRGSRSDAQDEYPFRWIPLTLIGAEFMLDPCWLGGQQGKGLGTI